MAMRTLFVLGLVLALGTVFAAPAAAGQHDGMRCGNRLVELGETTGEIAGKCGAPAVQSARTEPRKDASGVVVYISVDEWTYRGGEGDFPRLLTFENGKLVSVVARSR